MREIGKLFRKYGPGVEKIIGAGKNEEMRIEAVEKAHVPLRKLNSLGKKVYITRGNNEYTSKFSIFLNILKEYKNIKLIDLKKIKINGKNVVGFPVFSSTEIEYEVNNNYKKFIDKFKKIDTKNSILLTHIPPYDCEFDKITDKNNFNAGKHVGYKSIEKLIKKFKFPIVVCGHLEEYQGECEKFSSRIINPGAAELEKYAILEIKDNLIKAKVRFYQ